MQEERKKRNIFKRVDANQMVTLTIITLLFAANNFWADHRQEEWAGIINELIESDKKTTIQQYFYNAANIRYLESDSKKQKNASLSSMKSRNNIIESNTFIGDKIFRGTVE